LKLTRFSQVLLSLMFLLFMLLPTSPGYARQEKVDGPIYIVQEGDTLWSIAIRFRVSVDELARANGITNTSQIALGARLVIPGLEGISGILTTRPVKYGDTLRGLSRNYQLSVDQLMRLNHLTSPSELYAGFSLIIPVPEAQTEGSLPVASQRTMLLPGQSLLELAVTQGANPWNYITVNQLVGSWSAVPGEVLHLPAKSSSAVQPDAPSSLTGLISDIQLKPQFFVQGKVAEIQVLGAAGLSLSGMLDNHTLHFYPDANGGYTSLQGIYALSETGVYSLTLNIKLPESAPYLGTVIDYSQIVLVSSGNYPFDPVLTVDPETIDPAVTQPEDAQWFALAAPTTPEKMWDGIFQSPIGPPFNECWPSRFGNRRSYNGSAYSYFHTGLDFCGGVGTEIYAPAAGIVVFAGPLTVRGNATVINHGWGIYSAYLHQSEILVQVGDRVETGQLIGKVGGTGRVTGPHLHWEIWAGGVQVDPMDWLNQAFP
jgi:murein DD-endopeptidase MepM/ murein hydrolase activator NlpD